jgi:hypothetical protein
MAMVAGVPVDIVIEDFMVEGKQCVCCRWRSRTEDLGCRKLFGGEKSAAGAQRGGT